MKAQISLRRAAPADISAIMRIERVPGHEDFVGRSERAEHEAMFADPRYAYFLGESEEGEAVGFALMRDMGDAHGNAYLKRIAVARTGEGLGSALLTALLEEIFGQTRAHRVHLDCFVENLRARALYAKHGFTVDGTLRQAYLAPDGRRRDLTLMALLRPEWAARAAR